MKRRTNWKDLGLDPGVNASRAREYRRVHVEETPSRWPLTSGHRVAQERQLGRVIRRLALVIQEREVNVADVKVVIPVEERKLEERIPQCRPPLVIPHAGHRRSGTGERLRVVQPRDEEAR